MGNPLPITATLHPPLVALGAATLATLAGTFLATVATREEQLFDYFKNRRPAVLSSRS